MRGHKYLKHALAPLEAALNDPYVTDICVNRPGEVMIRRAGRWETLAVPRYDFDTLDAITIVVGQLTGREFDEANPYVNSTLPGGQRFQGVRPPGTKAGRILWAIRRPPTVARRLDDDDFDDLTEDTNTGLSRRVRSVGAIADAFRDKQWREVIRIARMSGQSIAFVGATGGGKTDVVRRAIQVHPDNARMVTIETDDELGEIGPPNKAPMFYDDGAMTADEAVRIALRLIPKEIVLQEVRGAEAYPMLRAASTGHSVITTWHGEMGREHDALCTMARMHVAGREMSEERLMQMARDAFDVVAYCEFNDVKNRFSISVTAQPGASALCPCNVSRIA